MILIRQLRELIILGAPHKTMKTSGMLATADVGSAVLYLARGRTKHKTTRHSFLIVEKESVHIQL